MKTSAFQRSVRSGEPITAELLLEEIAHRLQNYRGYPPILPHAGVVILDVLKDAKAAAAKQYTDD